MNMPKPAVDLLQPQLALVVDPDEDTQELYKAFLVPRRYVVAHAHDGRDALAKAIGDPPDVIITETDLPFIDGYALCQLLRSDPSTRNIPIVVVTADARTAAGQRARTAGADTVLVKPCLPESLFAEMETLRRRPRVTVVTSSPEENRTPPSDRPDRTGQSKSYQRYQTTTPPVPAPTLRCPTCDAMLTYQYSYVGGVTRAFGEQWDHFECPNGCGQFQHRHRTRKVTRIITTTGRFSL
jgi:CheY-like chemotaxis protein